MLTVFWAAFGLGQLMPARLGAKFGPGLLNIDPRWATDFGQLRPDFALHRPASARSPARARPTSTNSGSETAELGPD